MNEKPANPADELWRLIDDQSIEFNNVYCCALMIDDFLNIMYHRPGSDDQRINAHQMLTGYLMDIARRLDGQHERILKLATLLRADKAA